MQKVTLLCVGKLKERFYTEAVAEYAKRLGRFCSLDIIELPESRLPDDPSPAQIRQALEAEAALIRAKLPKGAAVIAMCIEGKTLSSPQLAERMARFAVGGDSSLVFLIGGSYGLDEGLNLITTPHIGAATYDNYYRVYKFSLENAQRIGRGEEPLFLL